MPLRPSEVPFVHRPTPPLESRSGRTLGRLVAVGLLALATPRPAWAQLAPLAVDVRAGATVPVQGFRRGPLQGGAMGRDASFTVRFTTRNARGWGVTWGFGQHRFDCAADGCPGSGAWVATDVDVGALRSWGAGRVVPWLGVALTVGRMEVDERVDGDVARRLSTLSAGVSGGGGVAVRVGGRWGLNPGLRYAWMNRRVPGAGLVRMRYLVADLGVLVNF